MSGRYLAKCSHCTYHREFGVAPKAYVLPGGRSLSIQDAFGWCGACNGATPCEALPALADVERLLTQALRDGNERLVAELEDTRSWISGRVSPPRCLDCGSTSIQRVPLGWSLYRDEESDEDFLDIPHPGCNGMLRVEMCGWSLYRAVDTRYSPEGEKLVDVPRSSS